MKKSEVIAINGEPDARSGPARVEHHGDSEPTIAAAAGIGAYFFGDPRETWEYAEFDASPALTKTKFDILDEDEQREVIANAIVEAMFSRPSDSSYVVYFGQDEQVVELRRPIVQVQDRQQ